MLQLRKTSTDEWEDWELPQIGKDPKIGYEYEYVTLTMADYSIRRSYKGKRLVAQISYGFLTDEQAEKIIDYATGGAIQVKITAPDGEHEFSGYIEVNSIPTKFTVNDNTIQWINWKLTITQMGVER